jgi:hypothetical protein
MNYETVVAGSYLNLVLLVGLSFFEQYLFSRLAEMWHVPERTQKPL